MLKLYSLPALSLNPKRKVTHFGAEVAALGAIAEPEGQGAKFRLNSLIVGALIAHFERFIQMDRVNPPVEGAPGVG